MKHLLSLLENIQQQSQQLLDCLNQEKQALDNNQIDQLNELSSHKQALVDELNLLDKQRAAIADNKDFNQFIASSNNPALISQWDTTRQIIAACQKQNELNGRLLNKHSQINQDILYLLGGRQQQANETYNAEGNQVGSSSLLNGIKV